MISLSPNHLFFFPRPLSSLSVSEVDQNSENEFPGQRANKSDEIVLSQPRIDNPFPVRSRFTNRPPLSLPPVLHSAFSRMLIEVKAGDEGREGRAFRNFQDIAIRGGKMQIRAQNNSLFRCRGKIETCPSRCSTMRDRA